MPSYPGLQILVLIDALGWSIIQRRDFLSGLLPYRQPLRTVLGFSSGAIPTILTGVTPAEHGHWNLYYYDPNGSPFRWLRYFVFLPDLLLDNRVSRKCVKEVGRRFLGLGPLFECCVSPRLLPWFNWVEKRSIFRQGGIAAAPSIFDRLAALGIPYRVYSYHDASDEEILSNARADLKQRGANFYFLYLSEMDSFLHLQRHDCNKINERLDWYEGRLRNVFVSALQINPSARLTIISDHGMTPVVNHFDLVQQVEALRFVMPRDYLAVYDSTMARFWFFQDNARRKTTTLLSGLTCGRILNDDELQTLGVYFSDHRYGEVIFLLEPGWVISQSDFNGRGWMPVGMHGYHPDDPNSDAVFLSNYQPTMPLNNITDVHKYMYNALT